MISAADLDDARAERCRRFLAYFVRQAWHVVEPRTPYVHGLPVDAVCAHLEAVWPGHRIRDLLINEPPRCAKSLLVSVFWPAWVWLTDPGVRFLASSYAGSLSTRDNVKCRRLIESSWYQRISGGRVVIEDDQNQKTRFDLTAGGGRMSTSVGAATTGEGGHVRILDDPHNVLEALSPSKRERAVTWHDEAWSTRTAGSPSESASVVIMQRCHESDLSGHLLRRGDTDHLCLPAEYEGPRAPTSIGWVDPRTAPGELLWPERFPAEELAKIKISLGSYGTAGQLQQRPSPLSGGLIDRAWFRRWSVLPRLDYCVASWDLSNSENPSAGSSFVVGQLWGVAGPERFLVDQVRARMSPLTSEQTIRDCAARWTAAHGVPRVTLLENKAAGPAVTERVRRVVPRVQPSNPRGSKEERVAAVSPLIESGNVWIPESAPWVGDFVEECAAFPVGHDDQVDTMTQALIWIDEQRGASAVPSMTAALRMLPRRDDSAWRD